jgi:hypothetical protein
MPVKSLPSFALLALVLFLLSCGGEEKEPAVTFSEPQPAGTDNLDAFPRRLQGKYYSPANNSTLLLEEKLISRIYEFDQKIALTDLDSNLRLSGDTLENFTSGEKVPVLRKGDTLVAHIHHVDTLFRLNYDNVVRKFKGYYFLNRRMDETSWEVRKMELSKGKLRLGSISSEQEIETLKAITETPQDTLPHLKFFLTRKQFREFLNRDGFGSTEEFIRVK